MPNPFVWLIRWCAGRWRYPRLLILTALVFVADLILPDVIPFADEILLGLSTVLLGSLKKRRVKSAGE